MDRPKGGAFHVLLSYMEADDRDKVEWAAAQNYLLTLLFCCHNLARIGVTFTLSLYEAEEG